MFESGLLGLQLLILALEGLCVRFRDVRVVFAGRTFFAADEAGWAGAVALYRGVLAKQASVRRHLFGKVSCISDGRGLGHGISHLGFALPTGTACRCDRLALLSTGR